jgi:hypothetical protein
MKIYAKALLGAKAKIEKFVEKLGVARTTITKPENYMSPDADYSVIEAQATSTSGSRYIYVYPKEEYWTDCAGGNIVFIADGNAVPVTGYSASYNRFGIGSLKDAPSGTYYVYFFNNTTGKKLFEIKLMWTNNV